MHMIIIRVGTDRLHWEGFNKQENQPQTYSPWQTYDERKLTHVAENTLSAA